MLTHGKIWTAIDALARRDGLSPSGLAKRASLDATAFNPSKHVTTEGRPRWPTTESLAKVLSATGATLDEFVDLLDTDGTALRKAPQPIPLIRLTQAGAGGFFDDGGFPVGGGWDQIRFPIVDYENAYALEVTGDSMQPLYRDGDGAAHGEDRGARLFQPRPSQSRLSGRAHRLDGGAHRMGEPIARGEGISMKTLSLLFSLLLGAAVFLIFVQPWDALEKLLVPSLRATQLQPSL